MFQLAYYSQADPNLDSQDVSIILNTARNFNSKTNITGCLLLCNGEFLQILEGEKQLVLELMTSIEKDERHSNITILAQEFIKKRMFSTWSMAFHELNSSDFEKELFLNNVLTFSEIKEKPSHVIDLFLNMAEHILTS